MNIVILDEQGYLPFSQAGGGSMSFRMEPDIVVTQQPGQKGWPVVLLC